MLCAPCSQALDMAQAAKKHTQLDLQNVSARLTKIPQSAGLEVCAPEAGRIDSILPQLPERKLRCLTEREGVISSKGYQLIGTLRFLPRWPSLLRGALPLEEANLGVRTPRRYL